MGTKCFGQIGENAVIYNMQANIIPLHKTLTPGMGLKWVCHFFPLKSVLLHIIDVCTSSTKLVYQGDTGEKITGAKNNLPVLHYFPMGQICPVWSFSY